MKLFDKKHILELLKLSLPMVMGNLGMVLITAGDCFVAGRYSTHALAAISIATSLQATVWVLGVGLLISISPILSNIRGAKCPAKKYFFPTVRFSMLVAFVLMLATLGYIPLLKYLGYEPQLLHDVQVYTFIVAFSTYGMFLLFALKEFLQSYEIVFVPNFIMVVSVILHVVLNFILVFGLFGCHAFGLVGLAISSLLVRTLSGIILYVYCLYRFSFQDFCDTHYYKQLLKVGLPISMAIMIEFLSFNSIAILLGRIAGIYAAAQSIILALANTAFMVPLGLSNAIAVKVGYANGAKDFKEMVAYSKNGIFLSILFMSFASCVFAIFPRQLASIFTTDKALIATIVPSMFVVAAFQISDGIQVALGGVFKGLKKTKVVMFSNLIAYLMIGVPFGYTCALHFKQHLFAYWAAFSSSSFLLSGILIVILTLTLRKLKKSFVV